jgi:hypothetical protein
MDLIGQMGDPKKVVAALQPIFDGLESKVAAAVGVLPSQLVEALDGMSIELRIVDDKIIMTLHAVVKKAQP